MLRGALKHIAPLFGKNGLLGRMAPQSYTLRSTVSAAWAFPVTPPVRAVSCGASTLCQHCVVWGGRDGGCCSQSCLWSSCSREKVQNSRSEFYFLFLPHKSQGIFKLGYFVSYSGLKIPLGDASRLLLDVNFASQSGVCGLFWGWLVTVVPGSSDPRVLLESSATSRQGNERVQSKS